jgi:hypothetical protein
LIAVWANKTAKLGRLFLATYHSIQTVEKGIGKAHLVGSFEVKSNLKQWGVVNSKPKSQDVSTSALAAVLEIT